jgi:hypothetical protein
MATYLLPTARLVAMKFDLFFLALDEIDSQVVEQRQIGWCLQGPPLDGNLNVTPRIQGVQELSSMDRIASAIER